MNRLGLEDRCRIINCLVEGNSINSTTRLCGVSKNTVLKLLLDVGKACEDYQFNALRNLPCKRVQCDEIWAFLGCKEKNVTAAKRKKGHGDIWTWTAICADTKLIPCWHVGNRSFADGYYFIHNLKNRLSQRVQLTTDGHKGYLKAVADAFGSEVDYAQLVKIYSASTNKAHPEGGYQFMQCTGVKKDVIEGKPEARHISTSYVERHNLSMRMGMKRYTRCTNAFSKKIENHKAAVALHFMHHNFCKIHSSLRVTPAMEAGITDHVWGLEEIIAISN